LDLPVTKAPPALQPLRIVFVGWGAIARACCELLRARQSSVALVGVGLRAGRIADDPFIKGVARLTDPSQLAAVMPDVVIEAASRSAVGAWGPVALELGMDFVPCSTGALCDAELFEALLASGRRGGGQVLLPAGALAGLDGLAAASRLELERVTHIITKPPAAWHGTEAMSLVDLATLTAPAVFFEGTARDAARRFPANANAAATVALATLGLDRTHVQLVADPAARTNSHQLRAYGEFGRLTLTVENAALADNPKSSRLTALSLVRLLENQSSILVI
jgi:aspartate dehydrogenase